ncbi:unnamed protein product [Alopecurus aequalis]
MATPLLLLLLLPLVLGLFTLVATQQQWPPIARPGCRDKCGNISIPYPFGIGPGCFIASQFEVFCNDTGSPPRAFLADTHGTYQKNVEATLSADTKYPFVFHINDPPVVPPSPIELMDISVATGEVRAYGAVSSYCAKSATDRIVKLQLTVVSPSKTLWPLQLSMKRNALVGVGTSVEARLVTTLFMDFANGDSWFYTACTSSTSSGYGFRAPANGSCAGNGCCQVPFAGNTQDNPVPLFAVSFQAVNTTYYPELSGPVHPCSYGMVVESSFYNFSSLDMYGYEGLSKKFQRGVPFVIDFAVMAYRDFYGGNGTCPAGGQQAPACASSNSFCTNATSSGYSYRCSCMEHYEGNPYVADGCQDINECKNPDLYRCNGECKNRLEGYDCPCKRGWKGDGKAGTCKEIFPLLAKVTFGAGVFIGLIIATFMTILLKERRKTRYFYKKNGGPILEKAKLIKLFRKKALKQILMDSNIIGKGFFGEVYKGRLDNEEVAIKKLRDVEVDTPMLVYEFIPKGSLHDILDDNKSNKKVALSLDRRLSIAAQSADGLAYMHSKTNIEILHGDVKPANILLDDNFVPKIADFGLSRLIVRDTKHTDFAISDINYMDPVYQKEGLLTGKGDVYSFGLVILELISRRKAVHSETNGLLYSFREAHEKGEIGTELFDEEIATEDLEVLNSVRELAMECLHLEVDQRPTMTEVAERLFLMSRSRQQ